MAREQVTSRQALRFGYNPVTGWLMELNDRTKAALDEVRKQFDEDDWKHGFTGNRGVTTEARRMLEERGVAGERLTGRIVAAYYAESQDEVRKLTYPYVRVKLVDGAEGYLVSFGLHTGPARMLIQKLLAVKPGQVVTLAAFGKLNDEGYANHAASLKDEAGEEIKGPGGLFKAAEAVAQEKIAALKAQGMDDRELIARARAQAYLEFHRQLLEDSVMPAFKAYADNARAEAGPAQDPPPELEAATAKDGYAYGGDGGFDEMPDDVPF
ncbi:hypothetical protein [Burkholderia pyrrocinia]|uniref:hypothetical protein n=1 Tax=Burkholderia pyrrocinia TaxID=60550 RepID=UPI001BD17B4C|nr:hypothetical protein [Burkholderia pyrrocinia]QVN18984.1 hypothetical protein JYG32_04405 [Burkholderia pyrrocinia]